MGNFPTKHKHIGACKDNKLQGNISSASEKNYNPSNPNSNTNYPSSQHYNPQVSKITIDEEPTIVPVQNKIIIVPVFYNTDGYDEFLDPVLNNISSMLNIQMQLYSIPKIDVISANTTFAIYAINLATDRLQEFLDFDRLQSIKSKIPNLLIICFRSGKNSSLFKKIENLDNYECCTLYFFDCKLVNDPFNKLQLELLSSRIHLYATSGYQQPSGRSHFNDNQPVIQDSTNKINKKRKKEKCKPVMVIYNCQESIDEWVQPIISELSEISGVSMQLTTTIPEYKQEVGIFMVNVCTTRIDEDINPILLQKVCDSFEKVIILVMRSGKKRMESIKVKLSHETAKDLQESYSKVANCFTFYFYNGSLQKGDPNSEENRFFNCSLQEFKAFMS